MKKTDNDTAPAFCPTGSRLVALFSSGRIRQGLLGSAGTDKALLKRAAVLIPLVYDLRQCQIVLTLRHDHLPQHGGQVSFPGGSAEPTDTSALHTALRESQEEIALPPEAVAHSQQLPQYITSSGYCITPFVGLITAQTLHALKPEPQEVREIFTLPLSHALNPARYQSKDITHSKHHKKIYALDFKAHYIWGATAGMLYNFRLWLWQNLQQPSP